MNDSEAREMARGLVRGSIIEDAASQFIAQVLKEAHDSRIKPLRDRIEELEAENRLLKNSGIIEVAVRNPNVMEYMKHWEGRAEAAEEKLAKAVDVIEWALIAWDDHCEHGYNMQGDWVHDARTTLAELTGGKDE